MKRPSFQFYPGDWQANSNLRRCTHAEKGIWLDVLCLLHDQPEYGVLRWPLKEIAQAVGCTANALAALVTKGVLKGCDIALSKGFIYTSRSGRKNGEPVDLVAPQSGPIWYSSRMVKDEYVRTIRGESTRFGVDNGVAPNTSPNPPFGDGSSSSSSSSSSKKINTPIPPPGFLDGFEEFWKTYPKKVGKDAAAKAFAKRKPSRELLSLMTDAIAVQKRGDQWGKDGGQFIPHPATWLNEGRWQDGVDDAPAAFHERYV